MKGPFSHSLSACFMLLLAPLVMANDFCTQPPILQGPHKPNLDKSYSTQLAGRKLDESSSEIFYEYYDSDVKKFAFSSMANGKPTYRIVDYFEATVKTIRLDRCQEYQHDQTVKEVYEKHMRSLDILLDLGDKWSNIGKKTIRGVVCDVWTTCITRPRRENYTATYYFTESKGHPFRLDVEGYFQPFYTVGGDGVKFHEIYDYFMYKEGKPPANVFEPPVGVVCNISTVKTPKLPDAASYRLETITPGEKKSLFTNVFYDKDLQMLKETYSQGGEVVRDFNRAIQFRINRQEGTCQQRKIFTQGQFLQGIFNKDVQHMASLNHYFLDDGDFTYNGEHTARGIPVDVYSRKGRAGDDIGDSIAEVFLSQEGSKWNNMPVPKGRVIRVTLKSGKPLVVKQQLEVVDFTESVYTRSSMIPELSLCYEEKDTQRFKLTFKGSTSVFNRFIPWNIPTMTSHEVRQALGNLLEITPLRVQVDIPRVIDNNTVVFEGRLYESSGSRNSFIFMGHRAVDIIGLDEKDYYDYVRDDNTPTKCAQYCLKEIKRPFNWDRYCQSFEFHREGKRCTFFNTRVIPADQYFETNTDVYKRTTKQQVDNNYLRYAWITLQAKVADGKLSFEQGDTTFTASEVVDNSPEPFSDTPEDGDNPMHNFHVMDDAFLYNEPAESLNQISLGACARQCLENLKFNCEAFAYNDNIKKCDLYDDRAVRYLKDSQVQIRRYDKDFHFIEGTTMLSPTSDTVYTNVGDTDRCAKLCLNNEDFFCESFELCDTNCILGRKHFFDAAPPEVNTDFTCTHFSRNYIQDYLKYPHKKTLRQTSKVIVQNIDVLECATQCSISTEYDCNMFQFCGTSSLCYLTTKGETSVSGLDYTTTGDCDVYKRKKNVQKLLRSGNTASPQSGTHSQGAMGGLAFGMILLGIIVVIAVALGVIRYKSSLLPDSMNIVFSKSQLDGEEDA